MGKRTAIFIILAASAILLSCFLPGDPAEDPAQTDAVNKDRESTALEAQEAQIALDSKDSQEALDAQEARGSLDAQEYDGERSLFEYVVIAGENPNKSREALAREKYYHAGSVNVSDPLPVTEEIRLVKQEDRWAAFIPSDLAETAHVCFDGFDTLELRVLQEDNAGQTDGSSPGETEESAVLRLRDGDLFHSTELENASLLHAGFLDKKGEVLEEGILILYHAEQVPTVYINTATGSMDAINADKSLREDGQYVFYTDEGEKDASGKCRLHGRGNSSWSAPKKQYSLNLTNSSRVLGMEESKKFALIANYSEESFLRNRAAFDLAAMCGMPSTPETRYVNVYFNGVYNGLYLLAQRPNAKGGSVKIHTLEKDNLACAETAAASDAGTVSSSPEDNVVTLDENGLEIHAASQDPVPENISGGYLLEIDGRYENEDYWFSTQKHHLVIKYPENVPYKEAEYIAEYVRAAERAFYSEDGIDPVSGKTWEEYLDPESWAGMYMLQDFLEQWDVESFSFFIYKDADDPLLYCGPVWDFDHSMGDNLLGRLPNILPRSMWLRDHREGWLTQLDTHPVFQEKLRAFAKEQFYPALEAWLRDCDSLVSSLQTSVAMNCCLWDKSDDFLEETQTLRDWLTERRDFMQDYTENPGDYCRVTFRYGFSDMAVYVRRGEAIGFVPTEEYGEHLYGRFRKKYEEIAGWTGEDGSVLTEDTVIDRDQVFTPFGPAEEDQDTE